MFYSLLGTCIFNVLDDWRISFSIYTTSLTISLGSVNVMLGLEIWPSGYGVGIQLSTQWRCNIRRPNAVLWPVITFDIHVAAKIYHIDRWWEMGNSIPSKFALLSLILNPSQICVLYSSKIKNPKPCWICLTSIQVLGSIVSVYGLIPDDGPHLV